MCVSCAPSTPFSRGTALPGSPATPENRRPPALPSPPPRPSSGSEVSTAPAASGDSARGHRARGLVSESHAENKGPGGACSSSATLGVPASCLPTHTPEQTYRPPVHVSWTDRRLRGPKLRHWTRRPAPHGRVDPPPAPSLPTRAPGTCRRPNNTQLRPVWIIGKQMPTISLPRF